MAAGSDEKTAPSAPTRPAQPYRQHQADQGRGDMVSENRAANARFERNSKALQQEQAARATARTEQTQAAKPELTFGPDRQHGQNTGQPKQEQADPPAKGQAQQQGAKKELSFGGDRQPNRPNYNQLKVEQAKASIAREEQRQSSEKKGLTFGPGREGGQGQDHGHGR